MTSDGAGGRVVWLVLAALLVLSIGPIFAVDVPAMVDYPNHLARMLSPQPGRHRRGSSFYQTAWVPYPNLAMDIVPVPWLARLMGVEGATRAFLLISELFVISGAMMLERVVKGFRNGALGGAVFLQPSFRLGLPDFVALGVALSAMWPGPGSRTPALARPRHGPLRFRGGLVHGSLLRAWPLRPRCGLHELWRAHSGRASLRETALTLTLLAAPCWPFSPSWWLWAAR